MKETTSLLSDKEMSKSPATSSKETTCKHPLIVISALFLLCAARTAITGSSTTSVESHSTVHASSFQNDDTNQFTLSLERKLELLDHWKSFLSWQDLWNQTKAKWDTLDKKNITVPASWNPPDILKNHTRLWANQTQEQGQRWWDQARDYFQNLTSDQGFFWPYNTKEQQDAASSLQEKRFGFFNKNLQDAQSRPLVYMNHTQAFKLLLSRGEKGAFEYSSHYFLLNQGLDAQINQAYCGVATSVAILNSLGGYLLPGTGLPQDEVYSPYPYATQNDIFNDCTTANVIHHNDTFQGILSAPYGLNLESTKAMLACYLPASQQWTVEAHHVDPMKMTVHEMRDTLTEALRNPTARVMINYDRATVGETGHGHFSPLGAYSPVMDSFLVLDVAKYKYPPAWIPTETLFQSLGTLDACGIWDGPAAQAQLPPELLHPQSVEDLAAAMARLHCQQAHRGFVVIQQTSYDKY